MVFEFLDVGMGDSTLIICPPFESGKLCLVDFGERASPFQIAAEDALKYLIGTIANNNKARNIGKKKPFLDYLFITHADQDHWNKLGWLIEGKTDTQSDLWRTWGNKKWAPDVELEIGELMYGGEWTDYENSDQDLADLIASVIESEWDIPTKTFASPGTPSITVKGATAADNVDIYILSANFPAKDSKNYNAKSLVLLFEYRGFKVILSGDATATTENFILKNYKNNLAFLRSSGLKLAHHGSRYSSTKRWLEAVRPQRIFASADEHWSHPYCDPIKRVRDLNPPSLIKTHLHRHACSRGKKADDTEDYHNTLGTEAICMNLWYVANEDFVQIGTKKVKVKAAEAGTYFGVQWELHLEGKNASLNRTDPWPPVV